MPSLYMVAIYIARRYRGVNYEYRNKSGNIYITYCYIINCINAWYFSATTIGVCKMEYEIEYDDDYSNDYRGLQIDIDCIFVGSED